jgi:tRNA 2-selenouridine synthase
MWEGRPAPAICCRLRPREDRITRAAVDIPKDATVAQLDDFDEVIDVRSPAEFALDHVPAAMNCPVLDNAERERVGTLHARASPFDARRVGAALVARNIARHLESSLCDRGRDWRPLVYCWRGGGRSDALCDIMRRIGWRAARLAGGYRAFRRAVLADLAAMPERLRLHVLSGRTGSGKSRVLQALADEGAQVLDLEQLASHRGSVLGEIPGVPQPPQKLFESMIWSRLRSFDPERPVFVEAESRKVGNLQVPPALVVAMRAAPCVVLEADTDLRIAILLDEYAHLLRTPEVLNERLQALTMHYGKDKISAWTALVAAGSFAELVAQLLAQHYDPAYDRSIERNFPGVATALSVRLETADDAALRAAGRTIVDATRLMGIHPE